MPVNAERGERLEGGVVSRRQEQTQCRKAIDSIAVQTEALRFMTSRELRAKHLELLGFPSRSNNRAFLRKKLTWHIQATAEGGASKRLLDQVNHLLNGEAGLAFRARERGSRPAAEDPSALPEGAAEAPAPEASDAVPTRDPRLPPPGTVLYKEHRGTVHEVTVLEAGFSYQGQVHMSLSKLARHINGSPWNGFTFFGLSATVRKPTTSSDEGNP